jgi:RecJ-like exonuclease
MIDLKQIENEINELNKQLRRKKDEYAKAKESNLKEQYGDNFGCGNCAYSCCVFVGDRCTDCINNKCIYCNAYCDAYIPENELSAYIREHYHYEENMVDTLNSLFDVSDIMKHSELYKKAINVLTLLDKEN